jgi:hypothetical protein
MNIELISRKSLKTARESKCDDERALCHQHVPEMAKLPAMPALPQRLPRIWKEDNAGPTMHEYLP